ncbi:MAG: beta-lactamase family protein [Maribacter sp.]|nr:beta-lactamase family protein [Maribacter sp.]
MDIKAVDEILKSYIDNKKAPSVQYIIFNKDSVIHRFDYGLAKIESQVRTDSNTTYSGFSVTKTFTALAILQLAEKGKLSIDDKAIKYLSDFPYTSNITIRQLLTHTAGIPNPLPLKWVHLPEESLSFDRNSFFKEIIAENNKAKSVPNEKFAYSNLGYFILGQVIEQVSGVSYEDYIREKIIHSLGINKNELDFVIYNNDLHAKGYQKKFTFMNFMLGFLMDKSKYVERSEGKWISFKNMLVNGPSYGGLIGTSNSFMRYIQELLKPDCILLSEEYKRMLFSENLTNSKQETGMCFSWFKGQLNNNIYYYHSGGGAGYYCEIRVYPELGIGSVLMFNRTGVKREHF